jgi:hypothetical protein
MHLFRLTPAICAGYQEPGCGHCGRLETAQMNQVWIYPASNGCVYHGIFLGFSDFGGTDISYRFHRLDDQGLPIAFTSADGKHQGIRLDIVSGSSLKRAQRVGAVEIGQAFKR